MKLALVGSPGSGKTTVAKFLASYLGLKHVECDELFWHGQDIREEVSMVVTNDHWIIDGHITKVSDLVIPHADKFILIEGLKLQALYRSLKRDWRNPKKAWYNLQNYEKMSQKRAALIEELKRTRPEDVLVLENFPNLRECELAAFCETLKPSTVESQEPAVKCERPRKIKEGVADRQGSQEVPNYLC
jgi:adenylate kinase family enzyme